MVSFGGGDSNDFGPFIRLSSPAPPCGDRHLPFAVAALALAVFAAHIIEQRLSARTTLAERIKECAELSLRLRARFALLRLIR
jgi:hypothetical protein